MIEAEQILMATGLVEPPTKTHVLAARVGLTGLIRDLADALKRSDPGRLYVCPKRPGYWERLLVPPDYVAYGQVLEPLVGHTISDAYQAIHQRARQALKGLRPTPTIQTVLGPVPMPLDSISEGRWRIEIDVVEGARLLKDFAAGALLREEVDIFRASFPDTYQFLDQQLEMMLNKKRARKVSYQPPMWLADAIRVFKGLPFDASLDLSGPTKPEPSPTSKPKKAALKTDDLKTRGQSVS